jgi:hypothetical protein
MKIEESRSDFLWSVPPGPPGQGQAGVPVRVCGGPKQVRIAKDGRPVVTEPNTCLTAVRQFHCLKPR